MGSTLIAPGSASTPPHDWEQTLGRAYDAHAPAVYGLARRVTRDDDVAAQLTAEVFAGLDDVTDEACLAECVLTDVHRRAVAWIRDVRTAGGGPVAEPALAALPTPQRQVIAAAYYEGLTYAQIARRLAMDLTEVADHMQRGLRQLAAVNSAAPVR